MPDAGPRRPVPAANRRRIRPAPVDLGGVLPERIQPSQRTDPGQDRPGAPCSIASVGMAMATFPIAVERGVIPRELGADDDPQEAPLLPRQRPGPAVGRHRPPRLLLPFPGHAHRPPRMEVRAIHHRFGVPVRRHVDGRGLFRRAIPRPRLRSVNWRTTLYRRADWNWACNGGPAVTHGWKPETGFIPHYWTGYDEALLLYVLGLGSPTHPLPPESYAAYCATYSWKEDLRPGTALLRAAVHPPAIAPVDRLPRHPGRVHARARQRLLREQPAGDATCSKNTRSATRWSSSATANTAGASPPATARAGTNGHQRRRAAILRLSRPRRTVRPGRRHCRPVGSGRLAAVRPGDRHPDRPAPRNFGFGQDRAVTGSSPRSIRRLPYPTARPAGG